VSFLELAQSSEQTATKKFEISSKLLPVDVEMQAFFANSKLAKKFSDQTSLDFGTACNLYGVDSAPTKLHLDFAESMNSDKLSEEQGGAKIREVVPKFPMLKKWLFYFGYWNSSKCRPKILRITD